MDFEVEGLDNLPGNVGEFFRELVTLCEEFHAHIGGPACLVIFNNGIHYILLEAQEVGVFALSCECGSCISSEHAGQTVNLDRLFSTLRSDPRGAATIDKFFPDWSAKQEAPVAPPECQYHPLAKLLKH